MEIRELQRDALSADDLAAFTRLVNVVDPERLPGDPPMPEAMVNLRLAPGTRFTMHRAWGLFDHGEAVGLADAEGLKESNNDELCELTVAIDPTRRRRGLGTMLFDHASQEMLRMGRTKIWAWGPIDDANRGFWENGQGYTLGYDERISRCVLANVDPTLMQTWIAGARDRAGDYHLERWVGRCPEHLVGGYAAARQAMFDAPTDDLDYKEDIFDGERMRDLEELHEAKEVDHYAILALHTETGDPAGYSTAFVPRLRPQLSGQGDTVTLRDHRNRGIGRWMKAEMWQWLRGERPDVLSLDTGNAESNDAMLAINVAMGFTGYVNIGVWH